MTAPAPDTGTEQNNGQPAEPAGQEPQTPQAEPTGQQNQTGQPSTQGGQHAGQGGQQGQQPEQGTERQPDTGQQGDRDWKADARRWEDRSKANKKTADDTAAENKQLKDTLDALRKALDPDAQEGEDPAKVAERAQQERDQKDQELRTLHLERAAEKAGRRHGADLDALLDSRGFLTALGKLDPNGDSFTDDLDAAVTKALEDNPRLKATPQAPARSVTDGNQGSSTSGQLTRADLAGMTPEQITQARKDGRLAGLLKGS